ncbi:type II toxin-antitoxin system VapB family antitoxin [uncultured Methylobacterium sp.]|uniref:type II toxin-antitoxin system VapB family antitoxin n=1 Tax=uncultured Methylobacterium sp. TaxID=157278 RepID=UPI0035C9D25D
MSIAKANDVHRSGGTVITLHIRDEETDRLVRMLAQRKRFPLTEAVKLAVGNELRREDETLGLWERLKPLQDRIKSRPDTGLKADKAFRDELSGDD